MKLVWKNNLGGQIVYRTSDPPKNGVNDFLRKLENVRIDPKSRICYSKFNGRYSWQQERDAIASDEKYFLG